MKSDFGIFFKSVSDNKGYEFNSILLDTILIARLPDNEIMYSIFTEYEFNGHIYALSLDLPSEELLFELFNGFFKNNLCVETISRFRDLFDTSYADYVKFDDYNFRFDCVAELGRLVNASTEDYIPFIVTSLKAG